MLVAFIVLSTPLFGQQLLDRVVARVNGSAITMTDVQAAIGLGLVDVPAGSGVSEPAIQQLIDRQLLLGEVARFPPAEPEPAAVDAETAAMKKRVGARLDALIRATGLDEARIHESARETLRIQAYLNQRFGTTLQASDEEVGEYYRAHPGEFSRDTRVIPFEEAEPVARQRAAAERRGATIAQWIRDLRSRAEITMPPK